jgi:type III secretion protein U
MDDVEIDGPIPADLFDAVAAILRLALDLPYEVQAAKATLDADGMPQDGCIGRDTQDAPTCSTSGDGA